MRPAGPVQLTWIVVGHDNGPDLACLLPSLQTNLGMLSSHGFDSELLVVDNDSRDDSVAVVRCLAPAAALLKHDQNLGFGAAGNRAAQQARGEWIAFSNADLELPVGGLDALPEVLGSVPDDIALVGPAVLCPRGVRDWSCGSFPSLGSLVARLFRTPVLKADRPRPIDWVTGACLFVRRDVFEAMGGFDERFFLYYEDVDLALRCRQAGHRAWFDPRLSVHHNRPLHRRQRQDRDLEAIVRDSREAYFRKHRPAWEVSALRALEMGEILVRGRRRPTTVELGRMGSPVPERG